MAVQGTATVRSFPLRQWVERLGGYVGEWINEQEPTFVYPVSLEEWRGRDLDGTWLMGWALVEYRLRGRGNPTIGRHRARMNRVHSVQPLRPE